MISQEIEEKVRNSFAKQGFMEHLGAVMETVREGEVEITCDKRIELTQQNDFFHAGVLVSICDSACGYAALTTMPLNKDVLSVEFKINLLRPSSSTSIIASGKVIKSGKTLTYCEGSVSDMDTGKLLARMSATMIVV